MVCAVQRKQLRASAAIIITACDRQRAEIDPGEGETNDDPIQSFTKDTNKSPRPGCHPDAMPSANADPALLEHKHVNFSVKGKVEDSDQSGVQDLHVQGSTPDTIARVGNDASGMKRDSNH